MPENFDFINKLFEKYEQMMFDIALNILQNRYDAEDVVQDAFSRLINNPKVISDIPDNEKRFYLAVMVKHISLNYIKKKKIHPLENIDEHEELTSNYSVEETALENITIEEISQALSELSDFDYSLMYLYVIMKMKPSEIAEELDIPEKNIRSQVRYAKKRLIKILKRRGFDYDV